MKKIFTLKSSKSKCLNGIINVPGDKSISQRALIFASLCYGSVKIFGLLESTDVLHTLNSLRLLGVKISLKKTHCEVLGNGGEYFKPKDSLDFGNSGTGVRLMIGLLSTRLDGVSLTGDKSLLKRPMQRVTEPLENFGARFIHANGYLPVTIKKSNFLFSTNIDIKIGSAQIKSAVILAAMNLKGESQITEFFPSRDHTEIMLNYMNAGITTIEKKGKKIITIKGPTILEKKDIKIPGDFSSAAFLIVACLICKSSEIEIKDVGTNFFRTGMLEVIKKMNGHIDIINEREENGEKFSDLKVKSSNLKGCRVTGKISTRLIDEYPILFVAASFAEGITVFENLGELKFKESDRLNSMAEALKKAGVSLKISSDTITIQGSKKQDGGCRIKTYEDHRIAMSMLVFGFLSDNPIEVDDIQMIETSFPNFQSLMKKIGANIEYIPK